MLTSRIPVAPYAVPHVDIPDALVLDGTRSLPVPALEAALRRFSMDDLCNYPSQTELESRLAARWQASGVCVTAGADDALARICRAFLGPGRTMVVPVPTFEVLVRHALVAGGDVVSLPWESGPFPVEEFISAVGESTCLVALVTPNNPTGLALTEAELERIFARVPRSVPVLVDAVYAEFAEWDPTPFVLRQPNGIAVRSFSKGWGLPSLRVGYAMAAPEVCAWLRAAGNPYAVAGPSLRAVADVLGSSEVAVAESVAAVKHARAVLTETLRECGLAPLPSEGNFVSFFAPEELPRRLLAQGIVVRFWPGGRVRVTVPSAPDELARLCAALRGEGA